MANKEFVFLYPIPEIIDFEINNHGWMENGGEAAFRKKYGETLNKSIDERYRQNGFRINYVIFNDCSLSEVMDFKPADRIIKVGLDYQTHIAYKKYPNQDFILHQLGDVRIIRIGGFHMWDCVQKLAKCAYENGLDVLVDEDLTEFFSWRLDDQDFRTDRYPTYNPRKQGSMFEDFIKARKHRPWLWQNY